MNVLPRKSGQSDLPFPRASFQHEGILVFLGYLKVLILELNRTHKNPPKKKTSFFMW